MSVSDLTSTLISAEHCTEPGISRMGSLTSISAHPSHTSPTNLSSHPRNPMSECMNAPRSQKEKHSKYVTDTSHDTALAKSGAETRDASRSPWKALLANKRALTLILAVQVRLFIFERR